MGNRELHHHHGLAWTSVCTRNPPPPPQRYAHPPLRVGPACPAHGSPATFITRPMERGRKRKRERERGPEGRHPPHPPLNSSFGPIGGCICPIPSSQPAARPRIGSCRGGRAPRTGEVVRTKEETGRIRRGGWSRGTEKKTEADMGGQGTCEYKVPSRERRPIGK